MQDVEDEPLFCEQVTIRVPSDTTASRRQQETRSFGTTRAELESLGDWLACWGVTRAGMEATGDYVRREGA
jgi:hypothetical protein